MIVAHAEQSTAWIADKEATKHRKKRLRELKGTTRWGDNADTPKNSQLSPKSAPSSSRETPSSSSASLIDKWKEELECKYCDEQFTQYSILLPQQKCVCYECLKLTRLGEWVRVIFFS